MSGHHHNESQVVGLEQALEHMRALSGEIDRLTESARMASNFLKSLNERLGIPVRNSSSDTDSGSSAGVFNLPNLSFVDDISSAISSALVPTLETLDDTLASTLSGFLLPEFEKLRTTFSDSNVGLAEATRKLGAAVDTLAGKIGSFSYPALSGMPSSKEDRNVILGSLHRLETEWTFGDAAQLASVLSPLAATGGPGVAVALIWAGGVMTYWAFDQMLGDPTEPIDERVQEGDRRLERVMRYGSIEEIVGPDRYTEPGHRHEDIAEQIYWFQDQIKAADANARAEVDPFAEDAPGALLRKENAIQLRRQLAQDYLAAIEHHKIATGFKNQQWDTEALDIAKKALNEGVSTGQEITPFTGVPTLPFHWEPITMEIKVLSDYKLSMRTDNPNPGLKVNVDLACGLNGMFYGRSV
jgi:hypothetical protein